MVPTSALFYICCVRRVIFVLSCRKVQRAFRHRVFRSRRNNFLSFSLSLCHSLKLCETAAYSKYLALVRGREETREVEVASYFTTDNTLIVSSLAMFKLVEPPSAVSAISTRQRNKESKPRVLALISCKFYDLRRIRFPQQAYIRPSRGVLFRPLRRRTTYLPTYQPCSLNSVRSQK